MLAVTNTVVFIHKITQFDYSFKTRKWKHGGGYTPANYDNIRCPFGKGQLELLRSSCTVGSILSTELTREKKSLANHTSTYVSLLVFLPLHKQTTNIRDISSPVRKMTDGHKCVNPTCKGLAKKNLMPLSSIIYQMPQYYSL